MSEASGYSTSSINSERASQHASVVSLRSGASLRQAAASLRSGAPIRRNVTVYEPNYYENKFTLFNIPRRVFAWIYSISLVALTILGFLFVAVTPIDVIVQTAGSALSGLKMFIVIIVWVVFLVVSILFYFSRLLQARTALNDVPVKSVYIPSQGDYPHDVYLHIDDDLRQCVEIGQQAGPLSDESIIINHPGLSPPEYVQSRNLTVLKSKGIESTEEVARLNPATLLPPDSSYEDIIRSVSDKFVTQRYRVFTSIDIPGNYTFREICIYLARVYADNYKANEHKLTRIIHLYEKFRFGGSLISDHELIEFMIEFDRLAQVCQSDYNHVVQADNSRDELHLRAQHLDRLDPGHSRREWSDYDSMIDWHEYPGRDNRYEDDHYHHTPIDEQFYEQVLESDSIVQQSASPSRRVSRSFDRLMVPHASSTSLHWFHRNSSSSSVRSVIRSKLALSKPSVHEDDRGSVIERISSMMSIQRKYSGYVTDSERSEDE
ncbi:hypothetical protein DIURU_003614 [Diutina rugosa]|uniref:Defect at low temperature protein 1 n=1 Tax=Diutina rugosa TaxID=5481 RepID=A0A642UT57_DIURU|nr:uncharacterized protein DIURU_003614 [Diutina rugosa]KAA8901244.1 hypothetical protein DIURU_003614 [Diutina rugosa]